MALYMADLHSGSLLERIADITSPYAEKSARIQRATLCDSVAEMAMCYLKTLRRTTPIDPQYGVENAAFLYALLRSRARYAYFKSIERGLLQNDARIQRVKVQDKSYNHAKNGIVQYLDILIDISKKLLDDELADDAAPGIHLVQDLTGLVFRAE